ncbi:hypothetical protein J4Q44_G00209730 [Coregonus suidteri]|uniref:Uncharacterized protein n=1 Tax=Coregonus suidteri TaxID=861788 RepID=A0AAN8QZX7_9TELE
MSCTNVQQCWRTANWECTHFVHLLRTSFTIPVLLSICCSGTLDGNMTHRHRELDVIVFQFTYSIADFVDYSTYSRFTYTTQISCFTMEGSRCQKPQGDQYL